MIQDLARELRYAAGKLRRDSSFAIVSVLTLGLGAGVLTALYAVVDAVLLRPIAVEQDRVVRIWKHDVERGLARHPISYLEFRDWREQSRSFTSLAAINYADTWEGAVVVEGEPVRVAMTPVSADFFAAVHRGPPRHGRWFAADDEQPGAEVVAVASERLARRLSVDRAGLVGRRLPVAGGEGTLLVVGVAPEDLVYPLGTDLWVPITSFYGRLTQFHLGVEDRRFVQFELLGRLAPGVSREAAEAELSVVERRWSAQFPDDRGRMRVVVQPVLDVVLGSGRDVLGVLSAAAGLVFVIAGANVAALLLMRASRRRTELAVRIALGASPARLARQVVTESLLLGTLGALSGLLWASLLLGLLRWLSPSDLPRLDGASLDTGVMGFCAAATTVWVLVFGTAPIWAQRRLRAAPGEHALHASSRSTAGSRGLRVFTAAQVAAAVLVSVGAGLLVRSLTNLQRIDRGFDSGNLAVFRLLLSPSLYPNPSARLAFYERLLPEVTALPGVVAATAVHLGPGTGTTGLSARMTFDGQTPDEAVGNPWSSFEPVLPAYFRTLGIPVVRGRGFTDADTRDGAPVAVVSEAVARRYWPGQDPLGRRVRLTADSPWATVVGVAADLRYRELTRNWLSVYFPASQSFFFSPASLVVRTAGPPEALAAALRRTIRAQDPQVPLDSFTTMDALLAQELSRPRTAFAVTMLFASMAILLAAVGVYGVISYEVSRQSRELAVRSALGATPATIFRSVIRRSLTVATIGVVAGLGAAAATARSLGGLLFELQPIDPVVFLIVPAALMAIVLLASCLPARSAAGADPLTVLRTE